jgi:hypothetical protein
LGAASLCAQYPLLLYTRIDSYYDAVRGGYYYNDGPSWVFSASLPGIYAGYNVARLHHIVVNYYGSRPYTYFNDRRTVYVQQYRPQVYRRQAYYQPREREGHWDNGNHGGRGNQWHGEGDNQDRGHGEGHGNGEGRGHGEGHGNGEGHGHGGGHGDE